MHDFIGALNAGMRVAAIQIRGGPGPWDARIVGRERSPHFIIRISLPPNFEVTFRLRLTASDKTRKVTLKINCRALVIAEQHQSVPPN